MGVAALMGNLRAIGACGITISPAQVAANTTAEQTFSVPGILANDALIGVRKPTAQAGLGIVGFRVTADGTIGVTFINATASPITPTASELYQVIWARPEYLASGVSA